MKNNNKNINKKNQNLCVGSYINKYKYKINKNVRKKIYR